MRVLKLPKITIIKKKIKNKSFFLIISLRENSLTEKSERDILVFSP